MSDQKKDLTRRTFLKGTAAGATVLASTSVFGGPLKYFKPTIIDNPLAQYPNRE